jgi:hypothetical protein
VTDYQCGSCSYGSNDLDELRQHSRQTGHAGGIETPEAVAAVNQADAARQGKSNKGRLVAEVAVSLVAVTATGAYVLKSRDLKAMKSLFSGQGVEIERLKAIAGGLAADLAKKVAEIDFLKSPSGAGQNLVSLRYR